MISNPCVGIHLFSPSFHKLAAICIHGPSIEKWSCADLHPERQTDSRRKGITFFLPRAVSDTSITPGYDIATILPPQFSEPTAVHRTMHRTFLSSKGSSCLLVRSIYLFIFFFFSLSFFRMYFVFPRTDTEASSRMPRQWIRSTDVNKPLLVQKPPDAWRWRCTAWHQIFAICARINAQ